MNLIFSVAVGGALGSVARFLVASRMAAWVGTGFPWGTLTVNVFGGFLMGILVETIALRGSVATNVQAFMIVGILGGFTTFSAFSLEMVQLLMRGEMASAGIYMMASVILPIAALSGAMMTMRLILA